MDFSNSEDIKEFELTRALGIVEGGYWKASCQTGWNGGKEGRNGERERKKGFGKGSDVVKGKRATLKRRKKREKKR